MTRLPFCAGGPLVGPSHCVTGFVSAPMLDFACATMAAPALSCAQERRISAGAASRSVVANRLLRVNIVSSGSSCQLGLVGAAGLSVTIARDAALPSRE